MSTETDGERRFRPTGNAADWAAEGWATEAEPLTAAPRLAATISIRLDPEAAVLVRRAARMSGITKSEFVRRSTVHAAAEIVQQGEATPIVIGEIARLPDQAPTRSGAQIFPDPQRPPATAGSRSRVLATKN